MRMRTYTSGHDGFAPYEAGDVDVAIDHARRLYIIGHGCPIDRDGNEMPIDEAARLFRLNEAERARAEAAHKDHREG